MLTTGSPPLCSAAGPDALCPTTVHPLQVLKAQPALWSGIMQPEDVGTSRETFKDMAGRCAGQGCVDGGVGGGRWVSKSSASGKWEGDVRISLPRCCTVVV